VLSSPKDGKQNLVTLFHSSLPFAKQALHRQLKNPITGARFCFSFAGIRGNLSNFFLEDLKAIIDLIETIKYGLLN
jgi:hypothetical protein